MRKIYLDYAASTPVDPLVKKAMEPYWSENYGNPGSLHWFGQKASAAIFEAREKIAKILNCFYKDIIFTGSATEANNLALRGIIKSVKRQASSVKAGQASVKRPRIITSVIEHESVLDTCRELEKEGVDVVYVPVDKYGIVDRGKLRSALNDRTILVSIIYANNEIGTIQPIKEIAKAISEFRKQNLEFRKHNPKSYILNPISYPLFHTDAVQAFNYLDCDVDKLGVDLLTLSSQKLYGPKGVGLLYVKNRSVITPFITGGGQEQGLRSGTENVPGIVGFSEAIVLARQKRKKEYARVKSLRDKLEKGIFKSVPNVILNGHLAKRLPNILNVSVLGIEGEAMLLYLDQKGIYVSTGSACSARALKPSHVILSLDKSHLRAQGTVRLSLGRQTTDADINYVLKNLPEVVKKLRQISPLKIKK